MKYSNFLMVAALAAILPLCLNTMEAMSSEALPGQASNVIVPPPPLEKPVELYDPGKFLNMSFPKYFNFMADSRGLGEMGAIRVQVKKTDPVTGKEEIGLFEVRNVGEIIASSDRGAVIAGDGADKALQRGKTLMSTNDDVIARFTGDLAKLLGSANYGDNDPYFREFPIYGIPYSSMEPGRGRPDRGQTIGELYRYKGKLSIVARVDGLAPISPNVSKALKRNKSVGGGLDVEPVTYVGRITYAVDAVELNDRLFVFIPLNPGPERTLEPEYMEPPDSYVPLGN